MKVSVKKSMTGGLVGTLAMTIMMYFLAPMMGMPKMDIAASLGNMLGIGWIGGLLTHFINGAVIFPLIYARLLYRALPGTPAVKGLQWGAILWLLAQTVVMPMMGGGVFSSRMGGMLAVAGSLLGHLVYGALLGAIAGRAADGAAQLRPERRVA